MVLFTKYNLGDQNEKNGMGVARSTYGGRRSAYRVLVRKPEGKKSLAGTRRRWEDNIKMDNFYCCTVHFDNTYVLINNKCTSLLHI